MESRKFTSSDVIGLAGITQRQLQWWTEQGLVNSRLEGHTRFYSPVDVLRAMLIAELRRRGVSLHRLRKMSASLDRSIDLAFDSGSELFLASDRRMLRLVDSRDSLNSLPEWLRGVFLIPISEFIQRIQVENPFARKRRSEIPFIPRRKIHKQAFDRFEGGAWMRGVGV
jgi:DNA-binding transcriptional MerR regulator